MRLPDRRGTGEAAPCRRPWSRRPPRRPPGASRSRRSRRPAARPPPRAPRPSGRRTSGSCGAGFTTTVLPMASAGATLPAGFAQGLLYEVMQVTDADRLAYGQRAEDRGLPHRAGLVDLRRDRPTPTGSRPLAYRRKRATPTATCMPRAVPVVAPLSAWASAAYGGEVALHDVGGRGPGSAARSSARVRDHGGEGLAGRGGGRVHLLAARLGRQADDLLGRRVDHLVVAAVRLGPLAADEQPLPSGWVTDRAHRPGVRAPSAAPFPGQPRPVTSSSRIGLDAVDPDRHDADRLASPGAGCRPAGRARGWPGRRRSAPGRRARGRRGSPPAIRPRSRRPKSWAGSSVSIFTACSSGSSLRPRRQSPRKRVVYGAPHIRSRCAPASEPPSMTSSCSPGLGAQRPGVGVVVGGHGPQDRTQVVVGADLDQALEGVLAAFGGDVLDDAPGRGPRSPRCTCRR